MTAADVQATDVRLVAADMDGTLLDDDKRVPGAFWPLQRTMAGRGIVFVPASGRQYETLRRMFEGCSPVSFIAENGSMVVHEGEVLSTASIDDECTRRVIALARGTSRDLGLVVCGVRSAYIERCDEPFLEQVRPYYAKLQVVGDLSAVNDHVLKLAICDFGGAEDAAESLFAPLRESHQVVASGPHWVDIMEQGINKGVALGRLQQALGVTPTQTVAFGDYLNDVEMLGAAGRSYAMESGHPDVFLAATGRAPSNSDHGVVQVLERLLDA